MVNNEDALKKSLENALYETDRIIDMFSDVFKSGQIREHERRDFSNAAEKILGIAPKTPDVDERLEMSLAQLTLCAHNCRRCRLADCRKHVVFGEGCDDHPDIMVIGEGPGENEDITGRPFVGKAGQYLDAWLKAISVSRDKNAYICNIIKCRPPANRDPLPDEKKECFPFLKQQIELVQPKAILCLGKPASTELTGMTESPMSALRGKLFFYNSAIPMICTYHPAAVLRDLSLKRPVWEDLQKIAKLLHLELVTR